jgi:hypothetical protein
MFNYNYKSIYERKNEMVTEDNEENEILEEDEIIEEDEGEEETEEDVEETIEEIIYYDIMMKIKEIRKKYELKKFIRTRRSEINSLPYLMKKSILTYINDKFYNE